MATMSRDRAVTIRIPEALLASVFRAARAEDLSAAEFIRTAVSERVAEASGGKRDPLRNLRKALRRDFASATDWLDLQQRLRSQNMVLRAADQDLWLMSWPVESRLMPLAKLGISREDLTLLYKAPFPSFGSTPDAAPRASRKAA